jgi:nucleotide-binding universal stress UspA family protein
VRSPVAIVAVLTTWALVGLVAAVAMRRRGHNLAPWAALGAVFGPLVIPLAVMAARNEPYARPRPISPAVAGGGPVDVLIGTDGSPDATRALSAAAGLFGGNAGRVTVAAVVDYDAALGDESEDDTVARTRALLESEAARWPGGTAGTVLLAGNPAQALVDHAQQERYHVVVVGTRGRGRSKAVLGSVAATLAKGAPVPVLMAGEGAVGTGAGAHGARERTREAAT